jgi:WD40 repeat protein
MPKIISRLVFAFSFLIIGLLVLEAFGTFKIEQLFLAHDEHSVLGAKIKAFGHPGVVTEMALSPDGTRLAGEALRDRGIFIWDISSGKQIARITQMVTGSRPLAFTRDGKFIVTSSLVSAPTDASTPVSVLDGYSGSLIQHLSAPNLDLPAFLDEMAINPKFDTAVFRFGKIPGHKLTALYETDTWSLKEIVSTPDQEKQKGIVAFEGPIHFSPDGLNLAMSYYGQGGKQGILVWNIESQKEVVRLPVTEEKSGRIKFFTYSPDGHFILVGLGNADKEHLTVWNADNGQRLRVYPTASQFRSVDGITWSPNGKFIVMSSNDEKVRVWDAASEALLDQVTIDGGCFSLSFSPDGAQLFCANGHLIVDLGINQ